jgi:uncharacterized caspase-like protein
VTNPRVEAAQAAAHRLRQTARSVGHRGVNASVEQQYQISSDHVYGSRQSAMADHTRVANGDFR